MTKSTQKKIKARLEYLRGEILAERISYGEIAELQSLAVYIEPGDMLLLEWAGVPESQAYRPARRNPGSNSRLNTIIKRLRTVYSQGAKRKLQYASPRISPFSDAIRVAIEGMPEGYNDFTSEAVGVILERIHEATRDMGAQIAWVSLGREYSPVIHVGITAMASHNFHNLLDMVQRFATEVDAYKTADGFNVIRFWWD